jgi:lipopolysaccharide/colanic/teichoic acid biosynthesis glycosyltransferase
MSRIYSNFLKRILDFIVAFFLLLVLSPVLLIVSIVLFFSGHRPVFFLQERTGYQEKSFRVIKFRTMTNERDAKGFLLPDEARMSAIGSFLRKSSIDELPQLVNVIKGEMSLIGPRPLISDYLSLYNDQQRVRHWVRPGISGWAQVNGRNAISWNEKFQYDIYYIKNQSLLLDLRIIFLTIGQIIKAEGISQQGKATVEPFNGTN